MEAVLFAVAAMTPGYAAVAVADEKERGTLPLLLTTALSDREIVVGKAAARVGFVLAAAAAALPVLAFMLLVGGVGGHLLLVSGGLVAGTAGLAAAIGVHAGCCMPDMRSALLRAYGVTFALVCGAFLPPCLFVSPFGVLVWLEQSGADPMSAALAGLVYPAIQLLVAAGLLADAVRRLRAEDPLAGPRKRPPVVPPPLRSDSLGPGWDEKPDPPLRPAAPKARTWKVPRVSDADPLLWKERYISGGSGGGDAGKLAAVAVGGLGLLLIGIGATQLVGRMSDPKQSPDEGGRLVMTGGTLLAGLYLFPAAIRLASAVARERRRLTLEPLLSLPLDRRSILRTKVRAAVEGGWGWIPLVVLAAGLSFGADGGWVFGLVAAAFALAGVELVVGLGAYLTVRCPSEVRAFRFLVPVVVVVIGAPVGVWNVTAWDSPLLSVTGLGAAAVVFALAGAICWLRAGTILGRGIT